MIPESRLVRKTVTFRVMDVPDDPVMPKDSLLRWVCLSLGLISENESRDTVIRVFDSLLSFQARGVCPSAEDLAERMPDVSEKTLRYHLKRMHDLGVLEKKGKGYSFVSAPESPGIGSFMNCFFSKASSEALASADNVFSRLVSKYSE